MISFFLSVSLINFLLSYSMLVPADYGLKLDGTCLPENSGSLEQWNKRLLCAQSENLGLSLSFLSVAGLATY